MNLVHDHIKLKKILKWLIALNLILVICVIVAFLLIANIYNDMGELWELYQELNMFLLEIIMKTYNNMGVDI